ncbi:hypothetical protein U3A58_02970 [Algoriphagus sp. C2-6-M1]|uniref:hypothetical protein n=1 Tax=Algoriphagus persicinus TaxID=3108754 RepID=UPI002B3662DF|nr:hypothetical protein [Algoriphagus sp. C2-6-M1]MEB2779341.1 hypothetical protein [Algoriphagus sp. C2-6-M1]
MQLYGHLYKLISETLGFEFFDSSNFGYDVKIENQISYSDSHSFLWHLKDLFNLKTSAMKKISILSISLLTVGLLFVIVLNTEAQSNNIKNGNSLLVELNADESIKRIETVFTNSLTLDSLVRVKNELQKLGISVDYKALEFDENNRLLSISCDVNCNDGFKGSFAIGMLNAVNKNKRIGFVRDYSATVKSPFCTGGCGL